MKRCVCGLFFFHIQTSAGEPPNPEMIRETTLCVCILLLCGFLCVTWIHVCCAIFPQSSFFSFITWISDLFVRTFRRHSPLNCISKDPLIQSLIKKNQLNFLPLNVKRFIYCRYSNDLFPVSVHAFIYFLGVWMSNQHSEIVRWSAQFFVLPPGKKMFIWVVCMCYRAHIMPGNYLIAFKVNTSHIPLNVCTRRAYIWLNNRAHHEMCCVLCFTKLWYN